MSIFDTILSSLRSLVGGGGTDESTSPDSTSASTDEPSAGSAGTVSVERETRDDRDVDASTEAAVKGTDSDAAESADTSEDATTETDAAAAETDASASTGTLVDEEAGKEPAEVVETSGEGEEAVTPDVDDAETPDEAVATETDASASTETLVDDEAGKEPGEVVTSTEAPEADDDSEETGAEAADADTDTAESDSDAEAEADEASSEAGSASVETLQGIGPAYAGRLEDAGIETVSDLAAADAADIASEIDVSEKRVTAWIERAREE